MKRSVHVEELMLTSVLTKAEVMGDLRTSRYRGEMRFVNTVVLAMGGRCGNARPSSEQLAGSALCLASTPWHSEPRASIACRRYLVSSYS
jgi:hypothetical protein